jgi:hypothetical protein
MQSTGNIRVSCWEQERQFHAQTMERVHDISHTSTRKTGNTVLLEPSVVRFPVRRTQILDQESPVTNELFPSNGYCTIACSHNCYFATCLHVNINQMVAARSHLMKGVWVIVDHAQHGIHEAQKVYRVFPQLLNTRGWEPVIPATGHSITFKRQ